MAQLNMLNGPVFDAGQSYSRVLSLTGAYVVGLVTPSDWTPAVLSILVSVEGDNYYDLFSGVGAEFFCHVTPGVMINVDPNLLMMAAHIKLRSGTRGAEVPQQETRRFYLITKSTIAGE